MTPDQLNDKELIEYYKLGMQQETKRADAWARSARLWRDFATSVNDHAGCPEELKTLYQTTMVEDSH